MKDSLRRRKRRMIEKMEIKRDSAYFTDLVIRGQIDDLLHQNAALECTIGRDSTSKEKGRIKVKQDRLFSKIKELDQNFYDIIVIKDDR